MEVVFQEEGGHVLGRIQYENIEEVALPAFYKDGKPGKNGGEPKKPHSMFLKNIFSSKPEVNTWKVLDLEDGIPGIIKYILQPSANSESLYQYAESQNKQKNPSGLLVDFCVVEVDFGYYHDIFSGQGDRYDNHIHVNRVLPGELHKRRPCIVLSSTKDMVKVIPLTSKNGTREGKSIVAISSESFKNLYFKYGEVDSFALLEMIETVSVHRIFPPKDAKGEYSQNKFRRYKITVEDRDKLKQALAATHSASLVHDFTVLNTTHESLKKEKEALFRSVKSLQKSLEDQKVIIKSLTELNNRMASFIYEFAGDPEAGLATVESILNEYEPAV